MPSRQNASRTMSPGQNGPNIKQKTIVKTSAADLASLELGKLVTAVGQRTRQTESQRAGTPDNIMPPFCPTSVQVV